MVGGSENDYSEQIPPIRSPGMGRDESKFARFMLGEKRSYAERGDQTGLHARNCLCCRGPEGLRGGKVVRTSSSQGKPNYGRPIDLLGKH
eukprot:1156446-Pelagomonas_calceolata.AAC.15